MGLINKVDMVCLSPVGYGAGDKHTISTLLIKPIFSVLAHAEKQFFSKLVFECLNRSKPTKLSQEGIWTNRIRSR